MTTYTANVIVQTLLIHGVNTEEEAGEAYSEFFENERCPKCEDFTTNCEHFELINDVWNTLEREPEQEPHANETVTTTLLTIKQAQLEEWNRGALDVIAYLEENGHITAARAIRTAITGGELSSPFEALFIELLGQREELHPAHEKLVNWKRAL